MKTSSKRKKFYLIAFIFLSLFICVESCLPSGISSIQSQLIAIIFNKGQRGDKEVLPTSLTIVGNETMKIGDSQQLEVNFAPEKVSDTRVTWSIKETDKATISNSGVVTALKEGTIEVRVSSNVDVNVFGTFAIRIEPVALESLIINCDKKEVSVGTTASFGIQYEPSNTTNKGIEWVSDDENIATINERGIVKGIQVGTCHIYAKSKYYDVESDRIKVTVNSNPVIPVTEINYSDIEEPIFVTQSLEINPTFNENATDQSFYMKSSDSSVFSISGHKIVGRKEGSAYLTIISNTDENMKSRDILVQVREVNATEVRILSDTYIYQVPVRLHYTLISENNGYSVTNKNVSFNIAENDFCTIDDQGIMYAKKTGKVSVTIFWNKDKAISTTREIEFVLPHNSLWGRINRLTRKIIGHFSLFLITGVFGMLTLASYRNELRYLYSGFINVGYGFLLGGISELLQLIPNGRACQFQDVIIDSLGYAIGVFATMLILYLLHKRIKKKQNEENIVKKENCDT